MRTGRTLCDDCDRARVGARAHRPRVASRPRTSAFLLRPPVTAPVADGQADRARLPAPIERHVQLKRVRRFISGELCRRHSRHCPGVSTARTRLAVAKVAPDRSRSGSKRQGALRSPPLPVASRRSPRGADATRRRPDSAAATAGDNKAWILLTTHDGAPPGSYNMGRALLAWPPGCATERATDAINSLRPSAGPADYDGQGASPEAPQLSRRRISTITPAGQALPQAKSIPTHGGLGWRMRPEVLVMVRTVPDGKCPWPLLEAGPADPPGGDAGGRHSTQPTRRCVDAVQQVRSQEHAADGSASRRCTDGAALGDGAATGRRQDSRPGVTNEPPTRSAIRQTGHGSVRPNRPVLSVPTGPSACGRVLTGLAWSGRGEQTPAR